MCMHWFRGELLRSPMALKILRKGDVIRLKQATSLHSILICLVPHIDCARNPTFQNWGVTVQRKFLREHSCASPDTLIVLLAFVFAHRWNMWRQKNRSCPWSNTLSSSTCSARFRHNPWKLLAKKCAGNNTSTKTFLVFFSRPLTSGISCRYYNLTALVICFFSPPAGWQTLVHAPGIHQWRRIVLVTIDRFESWLKTQFIVLGADLNATWSKRLWSCSFPVRHDGALNVIKSGWYLHSNRPECSILSKPSLQTSQVLEKGRSPSQWTRSILHWGNLAVEHAPHGAITKAKIVTALSHVWCATTDPLDGRYSQGAISVSSPSHYCPCHIIILKSTFDFHHGHASKSSQSNYYHQIMIVE